MTQVKICGITTAGALHAAATSGADFTGFVFFEKSPRHITPDAAAGLAREMPPVCKKIGLFVDPDNEDISQILKQIRLDKIQLHGNESPARCAEIKSKFKLPLMKAIKVGAPEDLVNLGAYQTIADWILFDAKPPQSADLPGGNGIVFDWTILKNIMLTKPWMLSGGLNISNIGAALEMLKPDAVDVSSGVEDSIGIKNPAKIRAFIEAVKKA